MASLTKQQWIGLIVGLVVGAALLATVIALLVERYKASVTVPANAASAGEVSRRVTVDPSVDQDVQERQLSQQLQKGEGGNGAVAVTHKPAPSVTPASVTTNNGSMLYAYRPTPAPNLSDADLVRQAEVSKYVKGISPADETTKFATISSTFNEQRERTLKALKARRDDTPHMVHLMRLDENKVPGAPIPKGKLYGNTFQHMRSQNMPDIAISSQLSAPGIFNQSPHVLLGMTEMVYNPKTKRYEIHNKRFYGDQEAEL